MRYLILSCVAALAALTLLPMTGCIDSANGLTDVIVFMSPPPADTQVRLPTPTWVWLMPADGSVRTPVIDPGAPPSGIAQGELSPDGDTVVYSRNGGGGIDSYYLPTGQVTPLYTGTDPLSPSYSSDGGTIVFSAGGITLGYQAIWTMDANGANPAELLTAETGDFYINPHYNRTGTKIVFQDGFDGNSDIEIMDANGSNVTPLTTGGYSEHPVFLPDGRILYATNQPSTFTRFTSLFDIWIMDADGGNKRNLTNTPSVSETHPSSNYAGTAIAYANGDQFGGDILVAPFDGTDLGAPVNVTTLYTDPCWNPTFGRMRTNQLESIFSPITM